MNEYKTNIIYLGLLLIFLSVSQNCFGQNKLESEFKSVVAKNGWSFEDSSQISKYDLIVISFDEDSITHSYLHFIEGYFANRCSYKVEFHDAYFVLAIGNCREDQTETNFIYGYLNEENLVLLLSENKINSSQELKEQKGWTIFKRIIN